MPLSVLTSSAAAADEDLYIHLRTVKFAGQTMTFSNIQGFSVSGKHSYQNTSSTMKPLRLCNACGTPSVPVSSENQNAYRTINSMQL